MSYSIKIYEESAHVEGLNYIDISSLKVDGKFKPPVINIKVTKFTKISNYLKFVKEISNTGRIVQHFKSVIDKQ